jgi:hypothetical protein
MMLHPRHFASLDRPAGNEARRKSDDPAVSSYGDINWSGITCQGQGLGFSVLASAHWTACRSTRLGAPLPLRLDVRSVARVAT